jgi:hypothetical protein
MLEKRKNNLLFKNFAIIRTELKYNCFEPLSRSLSYDMSKAFPKVSSSDSAI